MSTRFTFDTVIERGDEEIELRVVYSSTPFIAATYWQPAEGGEVEIISAKCDGEEFTLTDAEEEQILEECANRAETDWGEEATAAADWKYQEYRDRLLMAGWERDE